MANSRRRDPYKTFNFRVLFSAMVGAVAAVGIVGKLLARRKRKPRDVSVEEVPAGPRPIEGVGTSTAGRASSKSKQARSD